VARVCVFSEGNAKVSKGLTDWVVGGKVENWGKMGKKERNKRGKNWVQLDFFSPTL